MASPITNYQCPACTGPLHFSESTGRLECDYCGSSFTVEEVEALFAEKNEKARISAEAEQAETSSRDESWDMGMEENGWGADAEGMKAYTCPSCGAELICDETTAATSCPYCGNPTILPGQFAGGKKPDLIIPFKLDKAAAIAALKKHYRKKPLLPRAFAAANHIQEIQGIYVPFWLFDATVDANVHFKATISHEHTTAKEIITETDHFNVFREGSVSMSRVPVDGSSKMPDAHMDAIEPFDYSGLVPFSLGYLPGFLADKYDVTMEECAKRADLRCQNTAVEEMRKTVVGYQTCTVCQKSFKMHRGEVKYALLPVWMLHTKWNGKDFLFAMNGQTGKLIGDLPISWGKFCGLVGGIFLTAFILLCMFGF